MSKIAEQFIVEEFVKPAVMTGIDDNQFGTVPKSSTTQALISMIRVRLNHTDGNGSTVRVVLFDFKKAFDLINHALYPCQEIREPRSSTRDCQLGQTF